MGEAILAKGNRPVDAVPTSGSSNLITSGAVYTAVQNAAGAPEVYIGIDAPTGDQVLWFDTDADGAVYASVKTNNYTLLDNAVMHVSSVGNDELGNGSEEAPFATIGRAISLLPKNLNGFTTTIRFIDDNKTFNEVVDIRGFFGGEIVFSGSNENCTISNVNVTNCTLVKFENMNLITNGFYQANSNVYFKESTIEIVDANTGIELKAASNFITDENTSINVGNCTTAIKVAELSKMYAHVITGGSESVVDGIIADSGSAVNAASSTLTARTLYTTSSGGTISINAQPTIANY